MAVIENEEYHDDKTMEKVYVALVESGLSHDQSLNAILSMQNVGILFRERNRSEEGNS